jgi:hypothetical protein
MKKPKPITYGYFLNNTDIEKYNCSSKKVSNSTYNKNQQQYHILARDIFNAIRDNDKELFDVIRNEILRMQLEEEQRVELQKQKAIAKVLAKYSYNN